MLGIDVSKENLVATLLDPTTQKVRWERTVPNTAAGVRQLLRRLPADCSCVLEPTGRYSLLVVEHARAAGRSVLLAPPRKAKNYLKSLPTRAKTDRLDSQGLVRYALAVPLKPYPVKSTAAEQLDQLLTARKGLSDARRSLKQRIAELPHAATRLQESVASLDAQLKQLDREIEQVVQAHAEFEPVARVRQVPGIGPVTAAAAVCVLQQKQFTHPDQFVAYIGLDVKVLRSGKRQGQLGLSKEGDAELRRLFYCCAQSTLKNPKSPFYAHYERERQKGLKSTGALNAVARKMARLCWSLVKHGTNYAPERIYQQPPPRQNAEPDA
jgi:transposase